MPQIDPSPKIRLVLRIFLSCIFVFLIPILLFRINSPWLGFSNTKEQSVFEYLGFAGSCVLLINAFLEWKKWSIRTVSQKVVVSLFFIFAFLQLMLYSEFSRVGWDYIAYQESVRALLEGQSPYTSSYTAAIHPYIYPPLLAQSLTFLYRLINGVLRYAIGPQPQGDLFHALFYIYQITQLFLTILCYCLTYSLARKLNFKPIPSAILVTALFIFNYPLLRNFTLSQVNLWILICLLLALLWIEIYPFLAGAVVAFGTHLKIYPLTQLIPLFIGKKFKALIGFFVVFIGIFLLETAGGNYLSLWQDFFRYLRHIEKGAALRNNSVLSLTANLSQIFGDQNTGAVQMIAQILFYAFTSLLVFWVIIRCVKRFQIQNHNPSMRLLGLMIDSIFLMFFISPSVWDHHFVAAIPLAVWAYARFSRQRYPAITIACVLVFLVPTFEVWFFSYFRLIGLVILFYLANPVNEIDESDSATVEAGGTITTSEVGID